MNWQRRSLYRWNYETESAIGRLSLADAVYTAIADLEDATDQPIAHVSKLCGKRVTAAQFNVPWHPSPPGHEAETARLRYQHT